VSKVDSSTNEAVHLSSANARYLQAKVDHTAHTLDLPAVLLPSAMSTA